MFSSNTTQVSADVTYIEDVFSTWLYTGNGSTQTITNGIDLSGKGGLVWVKGRSGSFGSGYHLLQDSVRGFGNSTALSSNSTDAQYSSSGIIQSVSSTGFVTGSSGLSNASSTEYASWTFREQPKFFDVVTYTGNGTAGRTVAHNLGSAPGFMVVKKTSASGENWMAWHRSISGSYILLNTTGASVPSQQYVFGNDVIAIDPTSTVFTLASDGSVNANGATYVAYLFAHNAGGFGLTGTDNVISCGSYTGTGAAGNAQTLGYEPQWLMVKKTTSATQSDWVIFDNMRGWPVAGSADNYLWANSSNAEGSASTGWVSPNATGFQFDDGQNRVNGSGETYIYIAIRRGPMKVPTTGTSVFAPFYASYSEGAAITTNFPLDLSLWKANIAYNWSWQDRLRGWPTASGSGGPALASNTTGAETTAYQNVGAAKFDNNTGAIVSYQADSGRSNEAAYFMFRRAPSVFDEVCWTKSMTTDVVDHNLTVIPELIIAKCRSRAGTYWDIMPNVAPYSWQYNLYLPLTNSVDGPSSTYWGAAPTSTQFSKRATSGESNGDTFVAYLFATCPGVSKVGSYTGNGSTQTIACGFTGGARFVMIKQTSGAGGDWVVFSTAMGIVAGTDRTVRFNGNNATSTFGDTLDANNAGFELGPNSASFGINSSSETYIFLAIA